MELVGYSETLDIAHKIAEQVNDIVPEFDMFEPDSEAAERTERGNCFARAGIIHKMLENQDVEHYLQIASKKPAGLRYRHSQIIIPAQQASAWGVIIDTTQRSPGTHTYTRRSYADATTQATDLERLRDGQLVMQQDDFGGYLRRPITMQTFQAQQGIQQYRKLEHIYPR